MTSILDQASAESAVSALATVENTFSYATDLAAEAGNLTKAQILIQAGVAALAQAHSAPQSVFAVEVGSRL